jgi:hypothetical protein
MTEMTEENSTMYNSYKDIKPQVATHTDKHGRETKLKYTQGNVGKHIYRQCDLDYMDRLDELIAKAKALPESVAQFEAQELINQVENDTYQVK